MKLKVGDNVKVRWLNSPLYGKMGKVIAVGRVNRCYDYVVQFSHPYWVGIFYYKFLWKIK